MCIVGTVSCYWIVAVVLKELALQVVVTFELEIIHFAGFGGVGLFYRKVFPHRQILVLVCLLSFSGFRMHDWLNIIVHIISNL